LGTIGTGLSVLGNIQAGQAAESQAKSAESLAEFNAAVQRREATAIEQKSKFESKRAAQEAHRRRGAQEVAGAARGVAGSPVAEDLAVSQAAEDELEQMLIAFEGQTLAGRARSQADLDIATGKIARRKGRAAKRAGLIKAGTSLLTGFGSTK
jgi:hypothetical protein